MTTPADKAESRVLTPTIWTPPEYTMKQIYDAIPPHCFRPNTFLSLFYVLRDFALVGTLVALGTQIHNIPSPYPRNGAWVVYTFAQGLIFTGLWELAHECGHGALSKSKSFNHTVGLTIHSFLLVPFHSWRFTHSQHHKSTNNLEKDIAFVPMMKEDFDTERERAILIAFPLYLTINNFALERMAASPWWKRSHFYLGGDGPNFKPENTRDVLVSDVGIAIAATGLWCAVRWFGAWNVMLFYGFPYLWTNHWILTITFLQHTDVSIPYYPSKTWSFLRGAASTVDRDFGFIGRHLFHGAIETHVLHHHSSRIPFNHAAEASNAIKGVMGTHYQSDMKTPYLWAFWKNYTQCKYVVETEKSSEIYFFAKNK